jgi:hypothetical protein
MKQLWRGMCSGVNDSISDRRDCLRLGGGILDWSSGL